MENVEDLYELSPMQHGMLFDSVTVGDSGMYIIQLEYLIGSEKLLVPAVRCGFGGVDVALGLCGC